MTQANRPTVSAEAVENLTRKLAGRDPFDIMEEQLPALRAVTATLSDDDLRKREAPGKWSVLEVVQHLADTELAYGWRLRMVLSHDLPELQGFDQDLWAQRLRYNDGTLNDALDQLQALRAANLRIFRALDDEAFERVGIHNEAGPLNARMLLYILAGHDLTHRAQIDRIKRAIG